MEKGRKVVIPIILGVLAITLIGGCSTGTTKEGNASNTATGKNTSSESKGGKALTAKDIEKNIETTAAVIKSGKLVVFVKNNNAVALDMEIEAEFYDADGKVVGSAEEDVAGAGKNSEIAVELYDTPDSWDNYKIYVDAEETEYDVYFDKIKINHNNTKENVAVQVTNESEEEIEYIEAAVVYYKDNVPVGYQYDTSSEIKPGRSANFNIDHDWDKNYKDIKYDSYKVFVNEAYSFK